MISGFRHILQIFVIRWVCASYDYLSEVVDDILHNNW